MLPGLDGTGILLEPLLARMPPWIKPVVVKYPESGANTYQELLGYIDKELTSLGHFAILGWSFGGPLAVMIADRYPERVSALILCNTFLTPPYPALVPLRFLLNTPVIACIRALRRLRFLFPAYANEEFRRAKARTWRTVHAQNLAQRARAALTIDVRNHLGHVNTKMAYIHSLHDEVIPRRCLDEVLSIAPFLSLCNINGNHMALFLECDQAAALIVNFLCNE